MQLNKKIYEKNIKKNILNIRVKYYFYVRFLISLINKVKMKQKLKNQITNILFNWVVKESIDEFECQSQLNIELEGMQDHDLLIDKLMDRCNSEGTTKEMIYDKMHDIIIEWEDEIESDPISDYVPEPDYKYAY